MVQFQHIAYFKILAAIPLLMVLFFWALSRRKKTIKKIGDERLVLEMSKNYSPHKYNIKFLLVLTAIVCCVIALANMRSRTGVEKVARNGIDVMIALDVSKSMLAQDIKPSRLDRAKQLLGKLIDKLGNNRIGIVVFAGRAYLQMPLTGDHSAAKMYLASASTDAVPTQGTVLADALKMCNSAFNTNEKKYKAVILISDGEDHDEGALKIAGQMATDGIVIHTIGMGTTTGSTIIDAATNDVKKDDQGNTIITRLNESELMDIAAKANGIYQLYNNTDVVAATLNTQLNSMDQRTVTEDSLVNYEYYFQWFLLAALILLLTELFFSERKKGIVNSFVTKGKSVAFLIIAYCFLPVWAVAQKENTIIKKGNDEYTNKEYEKAISSFQLATQKNPANSTASYNLGNAFYRNQKTDDAVNAYDNALAHSKSKADRSGAYYNKGVVLQQNKKLVECIDAYKNALMLNPGDEDARQNLQHALRQQKQQQQKDKKDKEQQPKEDKKKEQQQQQQDQEKNNQPKPQPSKLTKQDAEEKLKALLEQEKNLQDKLRRVNTGSSAKPEKDW